MTSFNLLSIALDARRITHGTPELLVQRQHPKSGKFRQVWAEFKN